MTQDASLDQPHPELQTLRQKLHSTLESIAAFVPSLARPPIIDASVTASGESSDENQHQDAVHGLRAFRDAVRRDLENIEKFFADPRCASLPTPSTNASYLISVWHEVLLAPQPVTGIWSTFLETGAPLHPRRRGGKKEEGVKVDVVADGGKQWIRVNTIKNSRILAEFRELDSYLTDSDEEEELNGEDVQEARPSLRPTEFDNSVLRMARPILAAARANPIPGTTDTPSVTLQLTRLDPCPSNPKSYDDRIPQTVEELRKLGLEVRLGERDEAAQLAIQQSQSTSPKQLQPTSRINLDLSILIALVSDLTHASLPRSVEEAEQRFTPSASYIEWKKTRLISMHSQQEADEVIAKPSRALSTQALQEAVRALWDDMRERLASAIDEGSVEFWTMPEAVDRCMQIVNKIGGPSEKRRAQVLFGIDGTLSVDEQEQNFWKNSRYPRGYIPLFPIHIFPPATHLADLSTSDLDPSQQSPFFVALADTCRSILAQDVVPDPRSQRSSASPSPMPQESNALEDDGEIPRAAVTKANHKLTAHTVQTMLWGACRGWTILTANKASVKAILREMKTSGNAVWERMGPGDETSSSDNVETAALWVVDPRSLAEGMRSDFGTV